MGLFYKTGINGLKPKKLTDFILKKLYTRTQFNMSQYIWCPMCKIE